MVADAVSAQLFLVVEAGAAAHDQLSAALAVATVASVVIAPPPGRPLDAADASRLVELAQSHGAAALILDDPRLARTVKADGVHLAAAADPMLAYRESREVLGNRAIVGCDGGGSRHDAMAVAEAGADYIAFGVGSTDSQNREHRLDLVAWWAEIFEIPCVALDVETRNEAEDLARAGADFIGLNLDAGVPLADLAAHVRAVAGALAPAAAG